MDPHPDLAEDNPYPTLADVGGDARWAFGGGFDDPLEGVDTAVPEGVDAAALGAVCLALGDESLLLSQTLQRWCTRAPELEEEVTIANIALDLLGQTRLLYARAATAAPALVPAATPGSPVPAEDRLAFFREAAEFHAPAPAVMPDADFAGLMLRLAAVALWRDALWRELRDSSDPVLSAVAQRAVTEVGYHCDVATRWVRVLAGGTEESARRLRAAHESLAPHVPAMGSLPAGGRSEPTWRTTWSRAEPRFRVAWSQLEQLALGPGVDQGASSGSAAGVGAGDVAAWRDELVAELQSVARHHPEGRW